MKKINNFFMPNAPTHCHKLSHITFDPHKQLHTVQAHTCGHWWNRKLISDAASCASVCDIKNQIVQEASSSCRQHDISVRLENAAMCTLLSDALHYTKVHMRIFQNMLIFPDILSCIYKIFVAYETQVYVEMIVWMLWRLRLCVLVIKQALAVWNLPVGTGMPPAG